MELVIVSNASMQVSRLQNTNIHGCQNDVDCGHSVAEELHASFQPGVLRRTRRCIDIHGISYATERGRGNIKLIIHRNYNLHNIIALLLVAYCV